MVRKGVSKKYKWKAKIKGTSFWHYFSSKRRARRFVGSRGIVRRR